MSIVAYETNIGWDMTFPSIVDLTSNQFYFSVLQTDGNLYVNSVAGGPCIGVITAPAVGSVAQPQANSVRLGGACKIVCGGSFNPGNLLASDSSGRAVAYTGATVFTGTPYQVSGSVVLGTALAAGAINDYSTINFNPSGLVPVGLTG